MVNAIPGRNLPVLNFAYHLPKSWTDRFAHGHVNNKQHDQACTQSLMVSGATLTKNPEELGTKWIFHIRAGEHGIITRLEK